MDWWIYLVIAAGAILILIILTLALKNRKKSSKKAPKKAKNAQKEQPKPAPEPEKDEFEGIIFDEEPPVKAVDSESKQEIPQSVANAEVSNFEDGEFDAEAEKRYQEFLARHSKIEKMFEENKEQPKPPKQQDEFEQFRNQYCYSKYVTDTALAEKLKTLPPEARKMVLDDLFKQISGENFDIKI